MRRSLGFEAWVTLVVALAATHCGGDDPSEGERVCRDIETKLAECNLQLPAGTRCDPSAGQEELCAGRCLAEAPCDELGSSSPESSYIRCIATCSGAESDAFICDSGDFFVEAQGRCDGNPDCPDGSDEDDCGGGGDAGMPSGDAGS